MQAPLPGIAPPIEDAQDLLTVLARSKQVLLESNPGLVQEIRLRQQNRQRLGYAGPTKHPQIVAQLPMQVEIEPLTFCMPSVELPHH